MWPWVWQRYLKIQKKWTIKEKYDKLDFLKIKKKIAIQKDSAKKMKRLGEIERKYLQNRLIRDWYPEYTECSQH